MCCRVYVPGHLLSLVVDWSGTMYVSAASDTGRAAWQTDVAITSAKLMATCTVTTSLAIPTNKLSVATGVSSYWLLDVLFLAAF